MLADFDHLRQLTIADKLQLIELLWDDISASNEQIIVSPALRGEVESRLAEIERDPSTLIDRAELWRRVDDNRG